MGGKVDPLGGGGLSVSTNATGGPAAAPSASSSPDSDYQANASGQTGGYMSNRTNELPAPPEVQEEYFAGATPVEYAAGSYSSNAVAGPKVPGLGM